MAIIGTVRPDEARAFDSMAGYHQFHTEEQQAECRSTYGSFEIFWHDGGHMVEAEEGDCMPLDEWRDAEAAGWYWQACFPGCLPDGEPSGPFASSAQALEDADPWHPDFDF